MDGGRRTRLWTTRATEPARRHAELARHATEPARRHAELARHAAELARHATWLARHKEGRGAYGAAGATIWQRTSPEEIPTPGTADNPDTTPER